MRGAVPSFVVKYGCYKHALVVSLLLAEYFNIDAIKSIASVGVLFENYSRNEFLLDGKLMPLFLANCMPSGQSTFNGVPRTVTMRVI